VSGYAARLRLLKQVLRNDSGPAHVGSGGQGAAAVMFAGGARVVICADQVEVRVPPGGAAPSIVMAFADRLAGLAELPLVCGTPDEEPPDPSPS
jgi:hypothetical protein